MAMVEVKNLIKKYGDFVALNGISFKAQRGEVFVLLGPNGSGKTTILKTLVGLLKPTSGSIMIRGVDILKKPLEALRMVSYLPQRFSFPENLSGEEVLKFYCHLRGLNSGSAERVSQMMGIESPLKKLVDEYSVGMLQRLGLAIALLPQADILILDEPTVNLDPEGVSQFRQVLRELREGGRTIIIATHLLSESEAIADRVAIINKGRLISLEPIIEIKQTILPIFRSYISFLEFRKEFREIAINNGATEVEVHDGTLTFTTSKTDDRIHILNALRDGGAQIERFGTIEPPLEEIYMKILKDSDDIDTNE